MTVSLLAMLFEMMPVLVAAVISALIWNFFFIPPLFTFHIENAEDFLMFTLYFVVALVNAVLTTKIREAEKKSRDKEEKENTIRLYNTLLNSLSHEMRTPIATILGAVDTMKESDNLSTENKNELLNEIDDASVRLNRQVENLLNMSRLETGILKLKLDWCDVNELIFSVIRKFPDRQQKRIVYTPNEKLPLFKLDAGIMENVLHNILHNAVQYTPQHSEINIQAYLATDNLCIAIADEGGGFHETEIEKVFDKFYRLPNTRTGGTGLGLSIVRGFVQAHQGNIFLENRKDGGAMFTIKIPAETSFMGNLKNE